MMPSITKIFSSHMVGRHWDFRQPLSFTDSLGVGVVVISLQSMDLGSLNRRYEEKTEGLHQLT